jgi:hypothetical protein
VEKENTSWQKGRINKDNEYIELLWAKDKTSICLLQPSGNNCFIVEFIDGVNSNYVNEAERELNFYLIEIQEPKPWIYAKYHCSTAANLYSKVSWVLMKGAKKMDHDAEKIAAYLCEYKDKLHKIYNWKFEIGEDFINSIDNAYKSRLIDLKKSKENTFQKTIKLRDVLSDALNHYDEDAPEFEKIALWIIREWGHINTGLDTMEHVKAFLKEAEGKPSFERIASTSKVGSFKNPDKNIIYDSRVAYSMNWIILFQNAGDKYFPIPPGRNTKLGAFDLNALIKLENALRYQLGENKTNKTHISKKDGELFISKKDAYYELNKLIGEVNRILWNDGKKPPYYTEIILFSIADNYVFKEITEKVNITIK